MYPFIYDLTNQGYLAWSITIRYVFNGEKQINSNIRSRFEYGYIFLSIILFVHADQQFASLLLGPPMHGRRLFENHI